MDNNSLLLRNFEKYADMTEDKIKLGIETNRKGWAQLTVTDADGVPLPGVEVTVVQKSHDFRYGANIFMLDQLETDEKNEKYKQYFRSAFNMATLPFYWDALEPEPGKPRYEKGSCPIYRRPTPDDCLEFCEKNGIEPREHALAYEHFFPEWMHDADLPEAKRLFEKRCKEIAERYAGRIPTIEVTNEMFWTKPRTCLYRWPDFVPWCYKTAEKYFPYNKLCINEAAKLWGDTARNTGYFSIIQNALSNGARIDAVGLQYHMFFKQETAVKDTEKYYDPRHLFKVLDQFASFHLPIQITEVTIPAYSEAVQDEEIQARLLEWLYRIWFSHPNVEQIIYWNLVDGYAAFAPQGDMTSGENYYYGGLLRYDLSPKPAYKTIRRLFEKDWHTEEHTVTDRDGTAMFKGFYGEYDVSLHHTSQDQKITLHLAAGKENQFNCQL